MGHLNLVIVNYARNVWNTQTLPLIHVKIKNNTMNEKELLEYMRNAMPIVDEMIMFEERDDAHYDDLGFDEVYRRRQNADISMDEIKDAAKEFIRALEEAISSYERLTY